MAWSLVSVKIVVIGLTIGLAISLIFNVYYNVFNVVSTNIQLQNKVNNLNQTIIDLQTDNTALRNEVHRLEGMIEELRQQESELQKRLRLFMVKVYGKLPPTGWGSWYESIMFSANGIDHSVMVKDGSYSIELKNNQKYSVKVRLKTWFGIWSDSQILGELSLFSEQETYEKNW